MNKLEKTHRLMWCDIGRPTYRLEKSYVTEKKENRKWKHIDSLNCDKPIRFQSGSLMSNHIAAMETTESEDPYPV